MLTSELDVLKPIDPTISNSDDYEIYTLSGAQVYHAGTGEPASLLDAYSDTPLTVEGKLEPPERGQQANLVKRPYNKAIPIEITNVTRFSYGQTEDGDTVVWALGQAGWHELRPARSYKHIYQDMIEAIEILYFVTDIYNQPRRRGGGPSAELIFQEYAEDSRFGCKDNTKAAEKLYKYRSFLIMCMLNRAQGLGWNNTPLYQHMKNKFPSDFQLARNKIAGKTAPAPAPTKKGTRSAPTQLQNTKEKPKPKAKSDEAPKKDDDWWVAAALWEFMQKLVAQGAVRVGRITLEGVAKLMVKRYEIEDEETARVMLRAYSNNLRYMIQHPRRRRSLHFLEEPVFDQLAEDVQVPAVTIRKAKQTELRPRKAHISLHEESSEERTGSASSSEITTPKRPRRLRRGGLSVLRPKSGKGGKYSGKGKGVVRGKGKTSTSLHEDAEDSESGAETPMELSSPIKHKADEDLPFNPRKRAASLTPEAELNSPPSSPSSLEDIPTEPLPLHRKDPSKLNGPSFRPPIITTPLPSYAPNGPGDTYTCTFDGCSHKIYGASTDIGRDLIKEHLEDHAQKRQQQIDLIVTEEQKLRLPVNNLIKRIREMAEQQQNLFPAAGASILPVPLAPIERRL